MGKLYKAVVISILLPLFISGQCLALSLSSTRVRTDTTNFDGNLSSDDDTLQKALDTLDSGIHDDEYLKLDCSNDPLTDFLEITLPADADYGLKLDGSTNDYTGTTNAYGVYLKRDVSTAAGDNTPGITGLYNEITNSHEYQGTGTSPRSITNRGAYYKLTVSGPHSSAPLAGVTEYNYGSEQYTTRSGTITAPDVTIINAGTYNTLATTDLMYDNSGETLTLTEYGGYYSTNAAPTVINGTINATSYGLYVKSRIVDGANINSTAYGLYAKAYDADNNYDIYLDGGNNIMAASGTLTLGGIGNTNNEDLTLDFETTANTVAFGTSTGVTDLGFGSFDLTTTGNIAIRSDTGYIDLGANADDYKIQWNGSDAVHTITAGDLKLVTKDEVAIDDVDSASVTMTLGDSTNTGFLLKHTYGSNYNYFYSGDGCYYQNKYYYVSDVCSGNAEGISSYAYWLWTKGMTTMGDRDGGTTVMKLDARGAGYDGLHLTGTINLKEQAAANADTAAYGQIWVADTTPNELWFTDDAGTDTQLSSHPLDAPSNLYTNGVGLDWIGKRVQKYLGEIYWQTIDGKITVETFDQYNTRRKDIEGHINLVKKDWNEVHREKAIAEYEKEEVEITLEEAIEEVEITEEIESEELETKYIFVEGKIETEETSKKVEQGTGEFRTQLKAGIRLDSDTGKLYRKRTREEAEAKFTPEDIPAIPEWVTTRLKE